MPPTIQSLPTELISRIFEQVPSTYEKEPNCHHLTANALLGVCLVCKDWTKPDQTELWRDICFGGHGYDYEGVQMYVESEGTTEKKLRTPKLTLVDPVDEERVKNVLGAVKGVKSFELCAEGVGDEGDPNPRISADVFQARVWLVGIQRPFWLEGTLLIDFNPPQR